MNKEIAIIGVNGKMGKWFAEYFHKMGFKVKGFDTNDEIKDKIKKAVRSNASPRHVPSKIISILDIPKTKNGKLVELAVKQTVEGEPIKNLEALANPDSLKQFKNIKELNE